jgi:hypothetical protein
MVVYTTPKIKLARSPHFQIWQARWGVDTQVASLQRQGKQAGCTWQEGGGQGREEGKAEMRARQTGEKGKAERRARQRGRQQGGQRWQGRQESKADRRARQTGEQGREEGKAERRARQRGGQGREVSEAER